MISIPSKQSTKKAREYMWGITPCFLLIFLSKPLITSVSLEFLLTWSSMFNSSSYFFFACSANFSLGAVDSLLKLLILFWFFWLVILLYLPFYSGAKLVKFDIHFCYYFLSYFLWVIFYLFGKETLKIFLYFLFHLLPCSINFKLSCKIWNILLYNNFVILKVFVYII